MHNIYLFQVNYQAGLGKYVSQWLPYSVAAVWAYVEQNPIIKENFEVKETFFRRESVEDVLSKLEDPALCFFSNYIWNEKWNELIAEAVKNKFPNCKIVFGGPQVHDDGDTFFKVNPFVDTVVVNEGEMSAEIMLLDYHNTRELQKIYDKPPRVDLKGKPSPYLHSNVLQKIIDDNPGVLWAATLETNRGCPFKCSFCDWGSLTQSKITKFDLETVLGEIDWLGNNGIDYVIIADANFGVFYERDKKIVERLVHNRKTKGNPQNVNITWYKNSSEKVMELSQMLHAANLNRGLTLSVQSMNPKTLEVIERTNMESQNLGKMYKDCNKRGIEFYTEFILGLPYETKQSWREGICEAVELGCHSALEIFPGEILRNSVLAKQIEEHEMEIFQFETVEPRQITQIPERHNYIVSTKYMSRDDFLDSWMWGWLIINFHAYGWTQIPAIFERKYFGTKILDFYVDFFDSCVKEDEILWNLYCKQRQELKRFFFEDAQGNLLQNNDIVVYQHQMEWQHNRKHVQKIINSWFRKRIENRVPSELLDDILSCSDTFTVSYEQKNDDVFEINWNILDYVFNDSNLVKEKNEITANNLSDWDDIEDFSAKLALRHRYGFSKRKMSSRLIYQYDLVK